MQFDGAISLLGNTAQSGGAILAMNSEIMFNGETTIANNMHSYKWKWRWYPYARKFSMSTLNIISQIKHRVQNPRRVT